MLNKDILQVAEYIVNKEQSTNVIGIDQFNRLIPILLTQLVDSKAKQYITLSEWERQDRINNFFAALKEFTNLSLASGTGTLPTDLLLVDGITYTQTKNSETKIRKVDVCSGSEFMNRQTVTLEAPTEEHPISQLKGNTIEVLPNPLNNPYINLQYIRYPHTPYLDWYVDKNNNIVFRDENGSSLDGLSGDVANGISDLVLTGENGSSLDGLSGDVANEISDLVLTGIPPNSTNLYWSLSYNNSNGKYTLSFYDVYGGTLLCTGESDTNGSVTLVGIGGSGISGSFTLTISPYLTLAGNALSEISALSLYSNVEKLEIWWEIKCNLSYDQGNNTNIVTSFNAYTDITKTTNIFSVSKNTTGFTLPINSIYQGIPIIGEVTVANTFASVITSAFPNANLIVTAFSIQIPTIFNSNTYYYSVTDNGSLGVIFDVFTDSGMTNKIMTGTGNAYISPKFILLNQVAGSGYSGWVTITRQDTYAINGDLAQAYTITGGDIITSYTSFSAVGDTYTQLSAITITGANYSNTDNGKLYWKLIGAMGGASIYLYKDSAHTQQVAQGAINTTPNAVTLTQHSGSGITGSIYITYSNDVAGGAGQYFNPASNVDTHQLTNIQLSGVTNSFSTSGTVYFNITSAMGFYNISIYKESSHTNLVAFGSINTTSGVVNLKQISNSNIFGTVYLDYIQDDTRSTNLFAPVGSPASQLSTLVLNGVTTSNSDNGTLYYTVAYIGFGDYRISIYKDMGHTLLVAQGDIASSTGTVTITSTTGISGSIILNYLADDIDRLNTFTITLTDITHTGSVAYKSGDWDIDNTIILFQETAPDNNYYYLPNSLTVEIELKDEDKLDILWMFLEAIGLNISKDDVIAYAKGKMK
jgi:hypothetical protein